MENFEITKCKSSIKTLSLDEIVKFISSGNPREEIIAVKAIRKMLSCKVNPPIANVIELNLVPKLVSFLDDSSNPPLQLEATWALTNIASGSSSQTGAVIICGAVPKLVDLLSSTVDQIVSQAVWALANIAGESEDVRDYVLDHNVVEHLIKLIENPKTEITCLRNISWLMSNLCRFENPATALEDVLEMIPALTALTKYSDHKILYDVCWAFSYVTDNSPDKIEAVINSNCVPRLVQLLTHTEDSIVIPALRAIGNIVTGNDPQTDVVLAANVLPILIKLLHHNKPSIVKEAVWTVSNITAGTQQQIQQVLDSGIVNSLIEVLKDFNNYRAQREAVWAITNVATLGTTDQVLQLIERYPIIQSFCNLLASDDTKILKVVLNGIHSFFGIMESIDCIPDLCELLENIGGLEKLRVLQSHSDLEIAVKAIMMIKNYFSGSFKITSILMI